MKNLFTALLLLLTPTSYAIAAFDGKYLGFNTADEMCEAFGDVHATGIKMAFTDGH